jgi:TRAP-type mannitol/chloroaromatic compound transport system substrate-binding protein
MGPCASPFTAQGGIVPPLEVFGAVSSGAIPFGYDWAGYWGNQIPVAALLGGMPFGPNPEQYTAWLYNGGGLGLMRSIMAKHNVHVIPCQMVLQEAAGWFNKEIKTVADLKGAEYALRGYRRASSEQARREYPAHPSWRNLRLA